MILHKLLFAGVNTFTDTNLEMSALIKRERRSVRVYVVAHKCFVYVKRIGAVARRDDKQRV